MAGVGVAQMPGRRVQDAVEAGHEHVLGDIRHEAVVDAREHRAGLGQALRAGAHDASRRRHHHRGRNALVGDVADHEADAPVAELDEVVEVAADRARRAVERGQIPAGERRQLLRQEVLLDQLRDRELLLEAVARADLGLLLAHELADAHRRRRLRGERLEQPAVVGRVVLVGEPAPDVEQADELAVGDQRHDERDAGRPHLGERRRVQVEVRQVDRARGVLEVGDERIVGRDVERLGACERRRDRDGLEARSRARFRAPLTGAAGAARRGGSIDRSLTWHRCTGAPFRKRYGARQRLAVTVTSERPNPLRARGMLAA